MWRYICFAFLGGVSFGVPSSFVKLAYASGFTTADVVGAQFFFGVAILWIIGILFKKWRINLKLMVGFLLSGIPMALTTLFYYHSLQYVDVSIGIIMLFQFTWMGLLGEWIIDKRRPTRGKLISVVLLLSGSLLAVNVIDQTPQAIPVEGIIWGLLAALSFTVFIFLSGKVSAQGDPVKKSIFMATGAFLTTLTIYPPLFLVDGRMTSEFFAWGLIIGIFGVLLPPFLFSISLPYLDSGLGTILTASELPTSVVLSMVILHEEVAYIQWIGVTVILIGIVLPSLMGRPRKGRIVKSGLG